MDRFATAIPRQAAQRGDLLARMPLFALIVAAGGVVAAAIATTPGLGQWYLGRQDQWLLIAGAVLLILCLRNLPQRAAALEARWHLALAIGGAMALAVWAGHYGVLAGHDLSADEQLANFDAAIRAKGQFAAALPAQWRDHADALNTMFMYRTDHRVAWVSGYLPVASGLRAALGWVATPTLAGPLLTLVGALALWGCARRLWPDRREAAVVALLLYLGTGQIWLNGMTAYAMPGHLALNLCWLWLLLQRTKWGDVAALAVGFLAVGLHQLHYHPLFAAPILFLLVLDRQWGRAAFFLLGYLAIGLFWQSWSYWVAMANVGGALPAGGPPVDLWTRALRQLGHVDGLRIGNMTANLLRMVAWQHLLLLPLVLIGIAAARRDRMAAALLGGILLTLAVRVALQPYQGHGLGYRYTHGLIGNFILLAVYGWLSLGPALDRWRPLLLRTTAASCLVLLPMQAWMSHAFYGAFARVSHRIDASDADYVVIGAADAPFSIDLVRNAPYLDNRPIRLVREKVDRGLGEQLCGARPAIAFADSAALTPIADYFDRVPQPETDRDNRIVAAQLRAAGCRIVPF